MGKNEWTTLNINISLNTILTLAVDDNANLDMLAGTVDGSIHSHF